MEERRAGKFVEKLSLFVVVIAAVGAFLVLLDPKAELVIHGQNFAIGGDGFSAELKGAVITIMLIGGWTAAIKHWLDDTESGKKQQEAMSRIAEAPTAPAVTPAPATPNGIIPAAEVAQQPK